MEEDKTRKERLLKTFNNENKLWKGINKLMRRLVVETVTGYDEEYNKNEENRIPITEVTKTTDIRNDVPTEVTKTSEIHKDVEKVAPTSFMHRKVNNDPEKSLIHNNADTPILNRASKTLECCEEEAVLPNIASMNSLIHNDVTIVPKTQKSLVDAELQVAATNEVPKTLVNSEVQTAVLKTTPINSFTRNDVKEVSNKLPKFSLNNQLEKAEPNVASKSFLTDFNDAPKKPDKGSPQTFYLPIASILTYPTNLKVIKVVAKTSPITTLFPTNKSKQELVEKGVDPIQIVLPDDDELGFQKANLNYTFNVGILPIRIFDPPFTEESRKIIDVTGQTPPKDDNETRENEDTPKKTKSLTENQPVKETTSTANSTVLHNQQTTEYVQQYSKGNEQQQQNTITIDDNPKVISKQPSPEKKKSGKGKRKSVKNKEEADTSSHLPKEQTNLLMGTSTSKAVLPYYGSADKISEFIRGRELIVIKEPDEVDYDADDFIPPVANKSYVVDSNILKIETLDEDIESEDVQYDTHCYEDNDKDKQDLAEEVEVAETINPENSGLSYTAETLTERVDITTTDLHSKCDSPTKQPSQSNLPVSDVSNDPENVASIEALKQFSANQREYSQDNSDFDSFRNLNEYCSSDEFDETLKQSSSVQKFLAECNSQNDPDLSEQIDKKVKDLANSEVDGTVALVRRESGGS